MARVCYSDFKQMMNKNNKHINSHKSTRSPEKKVKGTVIWNRGTFYGPHLRCIRAQQDRTESRTNRYYVEMVRDIFGRN